MSSIDLDSSPDIPYTSHLNLSYSTASILNKVDVYLPQNKAKAKDTANLSSQKYWIIYIHGGGWRDPRETRSSFIKTLNYLDPSSLPIAGIASVDYRLSPHSNFPSKPGSDDEKARSVRHPTHVQDVLTGIAWLQRRYGFGSKYVLAGHSAGATMAFQAVMGIWRPHGEGVVNDGASGASGAGGGGSGGNDDNNGDGKLAFHQPVAILGTCGIYNLQKLVATHASQPMYTELVESAFGKDRADWDAASPAVCGNFSRTWHGAKVVVVAPSEDDELVDAVQAEQMMDFLKKHEVDGRRDACLWLKGKHMQVWAEGEELARGMKEALRMLQEGDS